MLKRAWDHYKKNNGWDNVNLVYYLVQEIGKEHFAQRMRFFDQLAAMSIEDIEAGKFE